jgi:uncharacterized phage protein (TIGR02218 family)
MKTISTNLQSHIDGEVTTLACCWKIIRSDGNIMGFTDASDDVIYDGITYHAATGFSPSAHATSANLAVDNQEVAGVLDAGFITEADIMAGIYDFAEIEVFQLNYNAPEDGRIILRSGKLGEVKLNGGRFVAEIRGITQNLVQNIGTFYSPSCRAKFGDSRCKKNLASYTVTASINTVISRQEFTAYALTQDAGYFEYGLINFTSGANSGIKAEIKRFADKKITTMLALPYDVAVGDGFSISAGCDKTFSTCISRFGNAINFRGEPHVPGMDRMLETASTRSLR